MEAGVVTLFFFISIQSFEQHSCYPANFNKHTWNLNFQYFVEDKRMQTLMFLQTGNLLHFKKPTLINVGINIIHKNPI